MEQCPAIGTVCGGLHQHTAREPNAIEHVQVALAGQFRRRVMTLGRQGKPLEGTEHMGMAVGRSGGWDALRPTRRLKRSETSIAYPYVQDRPPSTGNNTPLR